MSVSRGDDHRQRDVALADFGHDVQVADNADRFGLLVRVVRLRNCLMLRWLGNGMGQADTRTRARAQAVRNLYTGHAATRPHGRDAWPSRNSLSGQDFRRKEVNSATRPLPLTPTLTAGRGASDLAPRAR